LHQLGIPGKLLERYESSLRLHDEGAGLELPWHWMS